MSGQKSTTFAVSEKNAYSIYHMVVWDDILVAADIEGVIKGWDSNGNQLFAWKNSKEQISCMLLWKDLLYCTSFDKTLTARNRKGQLLKMIAHNQILNVLTIWHDKMVFTAIDDKFVSRDTWIFEPPNKVLITDRECHSLVVWKDLLCTGHNYTICMWNKNRECVQEIGLEGPVKHMLVDGDNMYVGTQSLSLWTFEGKQLWSVKADSDVSSLLKFELDVLCGTYKVIHRVNARGEMIQTFEGRPSLG